MRSSTALLSLLLLLLCPVLQAADEGVPATNLYSLHDAQPSRLVGQGVGYLIGQDQATFEQIQAMPADAWRWSTRNALALGTQPQGVWLRFDVERKQADATPWLLEIKWPLLDRVEVRLFDQAGGWGQPMLAGDGVPLSQRPLQQRFLLFPLDVQPQQRTTVFLHVHAAEALILPMQLVSQAQLQDDERVQLALIYMFFGGLLVILLYNCSLYLFTRDRSYLFYSLYIASAICYELALTGLGQLYFWREVPAFSVKAYALFGALTFLTSSLFARYFLELRQYAGWVYRVNSLLIVYWTAFLLPILFYPAAVKFFLPAIMPLLTCVIAIASTTYLWRKGNRSARLFTIAWLMLIVFTIIHLCALGGLLPLNTFTLGSQMLGVFVEFVLLSIALAERINRERAARLQAQEQVLVSTQNLARERDEKLQAQQQTLEIQRQANEQLEGRVRERTQMLQEAKEELEKAIEELARLTITDALTQLYNRRHFDKAIKDEMGRAKRTSVPLAVLMLDIDHFKQVNDNYGHVFGDECLRAVGKILQEHARRAGDLAARYGGEEFIMALPATDLAHALEIAEHIRQGIAALVLDHQGSTVSLTASLGVAIFDDAHHTGLEQLIKAADDALYRAKRGGRNQVMSAA